LDVKTLPENSIQLGLDLQGGARLVYDVDTSQVSGEEQQRALDALKTQIESRVNGLGVSGGRVVIEETGEKTRLVAELPGIENVSKAVETIGQTPSLQIYRAKEDQESVQEARQKLRDKQQEIQKALQEGKDISELGGLEELQKLRSQALPYQSDGAVVTGQEVDGAQVQFDPRTGDPRILVNFTEEGGEAFATYTQENVGKQMYIVLDGKVVSAPTINEAIPGGQATITGNFTTEEARNQVEQLNAGALPLPIEVAQQNTVKASLGQDALSSSVQAGLFGFGLVVVFMLLMYRLPGVVAVVALGIYALLSLTLFKLLGITLSLAGVMGFIVSLGLAVDGNILIFERMKEELRKGRELTGAIDEGFRRAWRSIRDSQISTLISALILFYSTTGLVQGFAVTLAIGVLVSLFTSVAVSRVVLLLISYAPRVNSSRMMQWAVLNTPK
jgi:preprotein translocase subunit SecD